MATYTWSTVAHAKQRAILEKGISGDQRSHAYLLHGLPHVGKKRIAHEFVSLVLCTDEDARPCGHCSNCKTRQSHPDVYILRSDTEDIGVDAVRSFSQFLHTAPTYGLTIGIVEDASRLTLVAANALLKILEEPPRSSMLVLITEAMHLLPVTIMSRCQLIKFHRLTPHEMNSVLPSENAAALTAAVRISQGRVSRAESFLDDNFASYHIQMKKVLNFLRQSTLDKVMNIPELFQLRAASSPEVSYADKARSTLAVIDMLESAFRDALLTPLSRRLRVHTDYTADVDRIAERYSLRTLCATLRSLAEIRYTIGHNANIQVALEHFALSLP